MNKSDVSIIIPAYNEAPTIGGIVSRIKDLYPDFEIIVINDGSTDETAKAAKDAGAIVYSHPYNIGNGAAIKSGIRIASGGILVFMDGDGQHDPEYIDNMLTYFPEYDMVVGARQSKRDQSSPLRNLGNKMYNWLASYVTKFPVMDLTSGFRAVKADIARNFLYLLPNTFSYPTTMTMALLRSGLSMKYIPIEAALRGTGSKSKIRLIRDGVRFFLIIMRIATLYSPFRIFLPVSAILFITGLGYYIYTFLTAHRFTNMSLLLFLTSLIIFMLGLISEQITQIRMERTEKSG